MGQKLKCVKCDDIIEGDGKGTFVSCKCGSIYIDETPYYTRIGGEPSDIMMQNYKGDWRFMKDLEDIPEPKKEENDFCIFLDIDGVLNSENYWDECYARHKKNTMNMNCYPFDPKCLNNLMKLCQEIELLGYEVQIILSSTWRLQKVDREIVKARIAEYGLRLAGYTSELYDRGQEISAYLLKHYDTNFNKYLILDDNIDKILKHHDEAHLIKTQFETGFNEESLNMAIDKLKSLGLV